jgi:hypothetical protein
MPRGRALSLALLVVGGLLVAAGVGLAVAAFGGPMVGVGVGGALLGVELLLAGLFLVPTGGGVRR